MLLVSLLIAAVSFAAAPKFEGIYSQAMQYRMGMSDSDCAQAGGKFEEGGCRLVGTNTLQIQDTGDGKNFNVSFAIQGSSGNECSAELLMKAKGNKLVPTAKLKGASAGHKLTLVLKGDELEVQEKLGAAELEENHSPGCGVDSFLNGNGHKFERN